MIVVISPSSGKKLLLSIKDILSLLNTSLPSTSTLKIPPEPFIKFIFMLGKLPFNSSSNLEACGKLFHTTQ